MYEGIELDNQVAIILAQLEGMFDFVASGITHIGLPPRYPDFDPDDYYDGGSGGESSNSYNADNNQEGDNLLLLFSGQNSTLSNDDHI